MSDCLEVHTLNPNGCGFFSCFTIIMQNIVTFYNRSRRLPKKINASTFFVFYKDDPNEEIFNHYVEEPGLTTDVLPFEYKHISFGIVSQYMDFTNYNYERIKPLMDIYFKPNKKVLDTIEYLKKKYELNMENTLSVYYRGTDKRTETKLGNNEMFEEKINKVLEKDPNLDILIQSDSKSFIDYYSEKYPKAKFISENKTSIRVDGIHKEIKDKKVNHDDMFTLLSTFLLISKSKYIICNSSNCSLWIHLYRGNGNNVIQYCNDGKKEIVWRENLIE